MKRSREKRQQRQRQGPARVEKKKGRKKGGKKKQAHLLKTRGEEEEIGPSATPQAAEGKRRGKGRFSALDGEKKKDPQRVARRRKRASAREGKRENENDLPPFMEAEEGGEGEEKRHPSVVRCGLVTRNV